MQGNQDASALLSDILIWMKYARNVGGRRETWHEIVERSAAMHKTRYPHITPEIAQAFALVQEKKVLPSMRSLQFAGQAIEKHESRLYNCCYAPIQDLESVSELFFNLLCGTGTGYSVEQRFISKMPDILADFASNQPCVYHIEDSIEGWSNAVLSLLKCYTSWDRPITFDYSDIRPKGTPLKTTGGYAPGHEPLKVALEASKKILQDAMGRKLRSLELHDIMCHLANAVYAGGIRRAAMICFFDRNDEEMMRCKEGEWWRTQGQRARANNSAVLPRQEVTQEEFVALMRKVQTNNTGEPGIYWTTDLEARSNPCVEASLDPYTFCNLTTINVSDLKNEDDFLKRCWAASLIGTLQASYTNFSYLSDRWSHGTRKSALLGVSLTGLASRRLEELDINLATGAALVKATNKTVANKLGIQPAYRTTLIKPEGTTSLVLGTSSGLHAYHSPYYLRGVTVGKDEPIFPVLMELMPHNITDLLGDPEHKAFAYFPIKSPTNAISRHDESALELLSRAKSYTQAWIREGHRIGENPHNASITVSVKEEEWETLIDWMWQHRDSYAGIAVLPYWGGTHPQLPFQEIDHHTFETYLSRIRGTFKADKIPEEWRKEALEDVAACAGGMCEI